MKKVFIISLLMGMLLQVKAQSECLSYINRIDSLIKKRNFDMYIDKPSVPCESYVFEYIRDKGFYGDTIEFYVNNILRFISENGSTKEDREFAINQSLLRSYSFNVDRFYRCDKADFNQQAINRLEKLLRKHYTLEEEERYIKEYTRFIFEDTIYITQMIHLEAQKREIVNYQKTKDSLKTVVLDKYKKKLYDRGYSIHLPILIGLFDMKEFIPLLDSIYNADKDPGFQVALARMGNKKHQEYFSKLEKIDLETALYIGTQDLIAKYGKELYSTEERYFIFGPPELTHPVPVAYNVIIDLQNNISNFPKLIDNRFYLCFPEEIAALPKDVLEKARLWMKENEGNYIIKPSYIPSISYYDLEKLYKK